MTQRRLRSRRRRRRELGLTLVELLVSLSLLTMLAMVVSAAFTVGLKALGAGGAGDRLAGAHDQMAFEQQLGRDVTRAACIQVAGGPAYGSCDRGFADGSIHSVCSNPATALCVGWPQVSDTSCHVAAYVTTGNRYRRDEYAVTPAGAMPAGSVGITTDTVSVVIGAPGIDNAAGYPWVTSLAVSITNTGVSAGRPTDRLTLTPLTRDPAGSAASLGAGGRPC